MKAQRHLALLRGINVGGKTIIKMTALKACFERMGFANPYGGERSPAALRGLQQELPNAAVGRFPIGWQESQALQDGSS